MIEENVVKVPEYIVISGEQMGYLKTLRHLPDNIVLEVAGQDFDMNSGTSCLVGWALRAVLAEAAQKAIDDEEIFEKVDLAINVPGKLARAIGGTSGEWQDIFMGVIHEYQLPDIETAFALRVDEAVENLNG